MWGGVYEFLQEIAVATILGILLLGLMLCTGAKIYRQVLIYCIPFAIGVAVKKYPAFARIYMGQTITTLCIIISAGLLPLYSKQNGSVAVLMIRFITGLTLTQVIYRFVVQSDFSKAKGSYVLCYLGSHSLEIYVLSEFFRSLFDERIPIGIFQETLLRMGYAAIVCIAVLLISNIVKQSQCLAFCFFGEKVKTGKPGKETISCV